MLLRTILLCVIASQAHAQKSLGAFGATPGFGEFYVQAFGAIGDGVTNDLPALQAAVAAADGAGGGTVKLGAGRFNLGACGATSCWKVGLANAQHHVDIVGISPIVTTLVCDTSAGGAAIYLNLDKYVSFKEFGIVNQGTKAGYGIQFGGDNGTGTQTNGNLVEHVFVQNFTYGFYMSGGIGTSSEIEFNHPIMSGNTHGFYSANFNALNFVFILPEIYGNTSEGFFIATGNMTVNGGASSNNGNDFNITGGNDGQVKIVGFRSETPVGDWLIASANNYISIEDCITHSRAANMEVINAAGELYIKNSSIDGYITWNGGQQSGLSLDHVQVNTAGTDWSLTNQLSSATPPFGPGFRMRTNTGAQGGARVYIRDVFESGTGTMYPDLDGVIVARPSDGMRSVVAISKGQGAALTITSNTLTPYAYLHHVNDSGLIKNITPLAGFGDWATQLVLIPDLAYTTDTTGDIGKSSTAIIGQPMIFTKDLATGKWYPSY